MRACIILAGVAVGWFACETVALGFPVCDSCTGDPTTPYAVANPPVPPPPAELVRALGASNEAGTVSAEKKRPGLRVLKARPLKRLRERWRASRAGQ